MKPNVLGLLMGFLVLKGGARSMDYGQEERKGKAGFCPPSPNGLYEPPCNVTCEGDSECRGAAKCCEYACHYLCVAPGTEKAGHCPPPPMKKLLGPALGPGLPCALDRDCPAGQKCCESPAGRACRQPLEDKPGKCPRRQRVKEMPGEPAEDTCRQDQECEGWKKCCFTGTSMGCTDVQ